MPKKIPTNLPMSIKWVGAKHENNYTVYFLGVRDEDYFSYLLTYLLATHSKENYINSAGK